MGVAAELGDQQLGLERPDQGGDHRVEGGQVQVVGGRGGQGQVGHGAAGRPLADLVGEAGAGEQVAARLVQRQGQDPGLVREDGLDPVAVVDVDVQVGDPLHALVEQPGDRHRRVVVDAEAAGPVGHGVVEPAGRGERVQGLAGADGLGRGHGGPADPGRRLVHPGEGRVVAGPEAEAGRPLPVPGRLDPGQVVELVHPGQVGAGHGRRLDQPRPLQQPAGAGQGHGELHPRRAQRVLGAEVVGGQRLVPDDRHRSRHPPLPSSIQVRIDFHVDAGPQGRPVAGGGPMHLPVGPDRTTGAPHKGFPHPSGAGDRAALTGSGCAAASSPTTGRRTPPPAWPPSTRSAATATLDRPGGRWGRSPSRTGARPGRGQGAGPGWQGGWWRWRSTPATPATCWPAGAGSGRAATAAGPGRPGPTTSRRPPSGRSPSPPGTRRWPMPAPARARRWPPSGSGCCARATAAPAGGRWSPRSCSAPASTTCWSTPRTPAGCWPRPPPGCGHPPTAG